MPWKLFDTPIVHNQIPITSLSCLVSLLFLKCALFLNWRSQLGHWLEDSMGPLLYMSWNTLPKDFLMICCKSMNYHYWLLTDEIQSAKKYCSSKSHHHFVIISSTQNYFYLLYSQQQSISIDIQKNDENVSWNRCSIHKKSQLPK